MRWCSFTTTGGGPSRLGAVSDRADDAEPRVLDVGAWARSRDGETPADLVDLLEASVATQERVADLVRSAPEDTPGWVRPEEVVYLAPLRTANSVRSLASWGSPPVLAHRNRSALLGPGEAVPWPGYATELAATVEVGCLLGGSGVDLDAETAAAAVFGYLVMNAWTVVGVEGSKARVVTSLGPWVTTPDAFDPEAGAPAVLRADAPGRREEGPNRRDWRFAELLAAASAGEEVRPTDLVSSGPLSAPLPVRRGDVVEATVAGLGSLRTPVGLPDEA